MPRTDSGRRQLFTGIPRHMIMMMMVVILRDAVGSTGRLWLQELCMRPVTHNWNPHEKATFWKYRYWLRGEQHVWMTFNAGDGLDNKSRRCQSLSRL